MLCDSKNGRPHPVDKVVLLVDIACQCQARTNEQVWESVPNLCALTHENFDVQN